MEKRLYAKITGVGAWLPETKLTNADLEKMVETSDEWIRERTGIVERRILRVEGAGAGYMGERALKEALDKAGVAPEELDLVVCGTVTPDMPFPATANLMTHAIGAKNAWGFDLQAACCSFLYALAVGAQFVETGKYRKVAVVGTDKMSSIIDYQDRNTCIIFGDGAGAVILEPDEEPFGVMDFVLYSDGAGAEYLHMKAGGSRMPASRETVEKKLHYVYQEGKTVFKHAVAGMEQAALTIMERNGLTADDIALFIPHQANLRIIDATAKRMGLPKEKVAVNIDRYANTTSATLPLCLHDYEKNLKKGDNLVLVSFGGGFTWGGMWLKWAY
ncbi:MAG: beta-ketoacyl-ACP synthase III [Bacteroidia bacterium]|nr:beta-ketoacyl-ACP synthase III [Bacteroidia bacterium]